MRYVKIGLLVCLLALCVLGADLSRMQTLLLSIASGDESLANLESFGSQAELDALRAAPPEQIQPLLAPAQQCLHSPKRPIRAIGVSLFMGVVLARRGMDTAKLLDDYIDDVAALLDDPDEGLRNGTVFVLGSLFPKPPAKVLAYFEAHLNDKANSDQAAGGMGDALLRSGNASFVPEVLRLAEQRPRIKGNILQRLGINHITTDEALKFLHSAFQDPTLYQDAVDAVGRLPRDARKGFAQDLAHVMEDPDTDPRVVESARQALTQ